MFNFLTPEWKKDPHKWLKKHGCEIGQDIEACESSTPFDFASLNEENLFNQQKHDDIVGNLSADDISNRVKHYNQLISPMIEKKYRVKKNKKHPFKRVTDKYLYITKGVNWGIYFSEVDHQIGEKLPIDDISGSSPDNGSIVGWNVSQTEDKLIGSYTIPANLKKITLSDPSSEDKYSGYDNSGYINPIELVIHPDESSELNEELFQNLTRATAIHDASLVGGDIRKLNKKSKKRKTRKKRKSKRRNRNSIKRKTKRRRH